MTILIAYDSLKGCLSAPMACQAAAEGVMAANPDAKAIMLPMSDGGDGFVDALTASLHLQVVNTWAHDAIMRPIRASYALSQDGRIAYMEMASAAGLSLIDPVDRQPLEATTYGVGELLSDAIYRGVNHIVIGLGGSATTDGGRGMIDALSKRYPDLLCARTPVPNISIVSDVTNPLFGIDGAAYVYAPQKGATQDEVQLLDARLRAWADESVASGIASPEQAYIPGAGAAGGLGYALIAYLGARMYSGIDWVLDAVGFNSLLAGVDLIITGEGCSDRQTLMGKVAQGILRRAQKADIPVCLLSGAIGDAEELFNAGFACVRTINRGYEDMSLSELLRPEVAYAHLREATERLISDRA